MLTGQDLLARIKEMGSAPRSELVRSCGYVSTRKDGRQRLNFTAFYEALLEAKGMHLGVGAGRERRRPGRHLSYSTRVLFNGNLLVGSAYTAQLGLRPGDCFEIKLGRHQIRLVPAGSGEESDGDGFDSDEIRSERHSQPGDSEQPLGTAQPPGSFGESHRPRGAHRH